MKKGFTTGTCAAAAAKAHADYLLTKTPPEKVTVALPNGTNVTIPIHYCCDEYCCVIKDAGDDPDITHGAEIWASVEPNDSGKIKILGGTGIGTVTKAGLQIPIGEPAINPVPQFMIRENVKSAGLTSCDITISVPEGVRLAEQTFNSRIGILGGISIIGTTGIVEPMSTEALTATIACEIDVQVETGAEKLYLAPGKIGEKHLQKLMPNVQAVITSNFMGFSLDYAEGKNVKHITLAGHPGKLAKIPMGYYNTHSKNSPMAQEYVAKLLGLKQDFNTVEEICKTDADLSIVAKAISDRVKSDYPFHTVGVILFDMEGNIKGRHDG